MPSRAARVVVIHALRESLAPLREAFARGWPEAQALNLLDDGLSADVAAEGRLTDAISDRIMALGRYAAATGAAGSRTEGILFSCTAFGPAIERVKQALAIPVLTPNEAAFERALATGRRIGILLTFPVSLPLLEAELRTLAEARGMAVEIHGRVADGALAALQQGDPATHDRLAAAAAAAMPPIDVLLLGQASLARAAPAVEAAVRVPVLTTPDSAVAKLKGLLSSSPR